MADLFGPRAASIRCTVVLKACFFGPCVCLIILFIIALADSPALADPSVPVETMHMGYTGNLTKDFGDQHLNTCMHAGDGVCTVADVDGTGTVLQCPPPPGCAPGLSCETTDASDCASAALARDAAANAFVPKHDKLASTMLVAVFMILGCCVGPCVLAAQSTLVVVCDLVFEKVRDRYLLVVETVAFLSVLFMYTSEYMFGVHLMGAGRTCRDTFAINPALSQLVTDAFSDTSLREANIEANVIVFRTNDATTAFVWISLFGLRFFACNLCNSRFQTIGKNVAGAAYCLAMFLSVWIFGVLAVDASFCKWPSPTAECSVVNGWSDSAENVSIVQAYDSSELKLHRPPVTVSAAIIIYKQACDAHAPTDSSALLLNAALLLLNAVVIGLLLNIARVNVWARYRGAYYGRVNATNEAPSTIPLRVLTAVIVGWVVVALMSIEAYEWRALAQVYISVKENMIAGVQNNVVLASGQLQRALGDKTPAHPEPFPVHGDQWKTQCVEYHGINGFKAMYELSNYSKPIMRLISADPQDLQAWATMLKNRTAETQSNADFVQLLRKAETGISCSMTFLYYLVSNVPQSMRIATLTALFAAAVSTVVFLRDIGNQQKARRVLVEDKFDATKGYPQDGSITSDDCELLTFSGRGPELHYGNLKFAPTFVGLYLGNFIVASVTWWLCAFVAGYCLTAEWTALPTLKSVFLYAVLPVYSETSARKLVYGKVTPKATGIRHAHIFAAADVFFTLSSIITGPIKTVLRLTIGLVSMFLYMFRVDVPFVVGTKLRAHDPHYRAMCGVALGQRLALEFDKCAPSPRAQF